MRPQGAKRGALSQAIFPRRRSRPEQPCASRPRRRGSCAGHKPSMRWSRVHPSPPSPPPAMWRMLPGAHGCSAWPIKGPRGCWSAHALVDRPPSPARWHSPARASLRTPPGPRAPALRQGVAAHWPPCAPTKAGASLAVRASAAPEKTGRTLLPSHRSPGARPGGSRLRFARTRGPRLPGAPRREPWALGSCTDPVALCPAPPGRVAHRPARPPPHPPAAPESEHTRGVPHTPRVARPALLEPCHQRRGAQGPWGAPRWHRQSLLYHRAPL